MKNSLIDVRNNLLVAMERLNDEELCADEEVLKKEVAKAQALSQLAEQIANINNSEQNEKRIELEIVKAAYDMGLSYKSSTLGDVKKIGTK